MSPQIASILCSLFKRIFSFKYFIAFLLMSTAVMFTLLFLAITTGKGPIQQNISRIFSFSFTLSLTLFRSVASLGEK